MNRSRSLAASIAFSLAVLVAAAAAAAAPGSAEAVVEGLGLEPSDSALAVVPDAPKAVVDYLTETDPCRLLSLDEATCAKADGHTVKRAFKEARRAASRAGQGAAAIQALDAAQKELRTRIYDREQTERAAQEGAGADRREF